MGVGAVIGAVPCGRFDSGPGFVAGANAGQAGVYTGGYR